MKVETLLSRLQKVKRTGSRQWVACCPAHDDRSPSMTVRELDDGRVLLHCFAGCEVENILGAVGLTFDVLFPDKATADYVPGLRRPFPAADVLECVATEARIAAIAAGDLAEGMALSVEARARLLIAAGRLEDARRLANG